MMDPKSRQALEALVVLCAAVLIVAATFIGLVRLVRWGVG